MGIDRIAGYLQTINGEEIRTTRGVSRTVCFSLGFEHGRFLRWLLSRNAPRKLRVSSFRRPRAYHALGLGSLLARERLLLIARTKNRAYLLTVIYESLPH